jgi:hypothetical protein
VSLDADRLSGLARTKLERLVRGRFPDVTAGAATFNAGVGLVDAGRAYVLLVQSAPSPMAAALSWGARNGAHEFHVIVDAPDPLLAVQARGLEPTPMMWQAVGTDLIEMEALALPEPVDPAPSVAAQIPLLEAAGCAVVVEHGVVIGEVLGLEVARVALEADGSSTVRVGVGLYDQEAHALVHARSSVEERLQQVTSEVGSHRHSGAGPHPLNRVARERWLRSVAFTDPSLLGLKTLENVPPLVPRGGIHEQRPVAARGTRDTDLVLAVFSTGIDLDLVPAAAAHLAQVPVDEVLLVLPARDHHAIIDSMASHLSAPARLVAIADPWA